MEKSSVCNFRKSKRIAKFVLVLLVGLCATAFSTVAIAFANGSNPSEIDSTPSNTLREGYPSSTVLSSKDSQFIKPSVGLVMVDATEDGSNRLLRSGPVCQIVRDVAGEATVFQTYTTLADAITASITGDTIEMLVDEYNMVGQVIPAGKSLVLTNSASCPKTTFYADTVLTSKLTIFTIESGASLEIRGKPMGDSTNSIVLDGSKISTAHNVRGLTNRGNLILNNVTVRKFTYGPTTSGDGGAALLAEGTTVIKGQSKITRNEVTSGHTWIVGGIFSHGGTLLISENAEVTENKGYDGGGIGVGGNSVVTLRDHATIAQNISTNPGGGVYIYNADYTEVRSGTFNMEGGSITGNFATNYGGGGIFIHAGGTLNISGGTISNNATTAGRTGGGVYGYTHDRVQINVWGTPVVRDNVVGATWNEATYTFTTSSPKTSNITLSGSTSPSLLYLTVKGDLLSGSYIGVNTVDAPRNLAGAQFGWISPSGSTFKGLHYFKNDNDNKIYGMKSDADKVVWVEGTCQIIRKISGVSTFIGMYPTLDEACKEVITGDTIEIFKSHAVTDVSKITVDNVIIGTAPLVSPSAPGALCFQPGAGETNKASITRVNAGKTILSTSFHTEVHDVIFDGEQKVAATRLIEAQNGSELELIDCIARNNVTTAISAYEGSKVIVDKTTITQTKDSIVSEGDITIKNTTITNNQVTTAIGGAVDVFGGKITLSNLVTIADNFYLGKQANIRLRVASDVINILDKLADGSRVGVSVKSLTEHVPFHRFARGFLAGAVADTQVAAQSLQYFFDDYVPSITIAANNPSARPDLDSYLFFAGVDFKFTKLSDRSEVPLSGAVFRVYAYLLGDIPEKTYLAESTVQSSSDWQQIGGDFTSNELGLVDFGALGNGYYRIYEVTTPANHTAYSGQWVLEADSTKAQENKLIFTSIKENIDDLTLDFEMIQSGDSYLYQVKNHYLSGDLKVSKQMSGSYADKTKQCDFTGIISSETAPIFTDFTAQVYGSDGTAVGDSFEVPFNTTFTFNLIHGQYILINGLPEGTLFKIIEQPMDGYAEGIQSVVPSGAEQLLVEESSVSGKIAQGVTDIGYTNTYKHVVPTGLRLFNIALFPVLALIILVLYLIISRKIRISRS